MFKISSQEEFGLRFLLILAKAKGKEVTLSEISEKEGVSLAYVRKIFGVLRNGELVRASKGVQAGYSLIKDPIEISLNDIFGVLKPSPHEFSCNDFTGQLSVCAHYSDCSVRPLLSLIERKIEGFLKNISLGELIKEEKDVVKFLAETDQQNTLKDLEKVG